MIYWCDECRIPIFSYSECPNCNTELRYISSSSICNPVFLQERKLISLILHNDLTQENIWYLGNAKYLLNGEIIRLPFMGFYKNKDHLKIAATLRNSIDTCDKIPNIENFITANTNYICQKIYEAENYVNETAKEYLNDGYVPTISFSGGKDSTVVSRIVRDALQKDSIIHYFGDTTLEFPSTYSYIYNVFREENPIPPILPSETENDFFKLCNVFGPPSKFERWCCTIFKTSNLNTEFLDLAGRSLTFLGIRRSESNERRNYKRTQKDSKISTQLNAMPIIDWTDYDVWLYILYKNIEFNDAYKLGYKRVGCWCCPNNSDWAMMLTDIYYPEHALSWKKILYDFAIKTNKTDIEDYVENGKWTTRKGASGLETKNVTITDTPCNLSDKARNIITKKSINRDVIEFFKPFGQLDVFDKDDATNIIITEREIRDPSSGSVVFPQRKLCDVIITFGTKVIKVVPNNGVDSLLLINRIKCQIRKYQFCIKCTACDSICPRAAINTIGNNRYTVDENKCYQNLNRCSKCIAKFYNGCITCQVLAGKKNVIGDEVI